MQNPSQDPSEYSQVGLQENTQNADSWKQEDTCESSSSTSTSKLVLEVNTKKDLHNMRISNHQYLTKGFPTFATEVGNHSGSLNMCN